MPSARHRLRGVITSAGFASGDRIVVGAWASGPIGPMDDVMWVRPDGERVLLAPSRAVADFVTAVYRFDAVEVVPLSVSVDRRHLRLDAGALRMSVTAGRGWAIPLAALRPPVVTRYVEGPVARALMGVHTFGVTPSGVHEWYQADEHRPLVAGAARLDGVDLGPLAPIRPPLAVGVSEPPERPSMVRVRPLLWDPAGRLDRVLAGGVG